MKHFPFVYTSGKSADMFLGTGLSMFMFGNSTCSRWQRKRQKPDRVSSPYSGILIINSYVEVHNPHRYESSTKIVHVPWVGRMAVLSPLSVTETWVSVSSCMWKRVGRFSFRCIQLPCDLGRRPSLVSCCRDGVS